MTVRVLVCGGRNFADWPLMLDTLDHIHTVTPIEAILQGGATGADYYAAAWADLRHVENVPFPASWVRHGKAAGPIRNRQMLDEGRPALVVAFPGGRGTADMVGRARRAGIVVVLAGAPS